jgi:hypothetical protein
MAVAGFVNLEDNRPGTILGCMAVRYKNVRPAVALTVAAHDHLPPSPELSTFRCPAQGTETAMPAPLGQ